MGHDTHFLERLDRVADAHVERALTLYRDQALLREAARRSRGCVRCGPRVSAEEIAAVPELVGRAFLGVLPLSWLTDQVSFDLLEQVAATLPWIARAQPAELFLPCEYCTALPVSSVQEVGLMVSGYARNNSLSRPPPVERKTEKLGRNDPCWCGSGQKLKRCCVTVG